MKKLLPLIGVAAACGACCAIPLLTAFTGIAASSAGAAVLGWEAGLAMLAIAIAALWIRRRRAKRTTKGVVAAAEASCGCAPSSREDGQVCAMPRPLAKQSNSR